MKAKINNTQQKSKCMLSGDRDETVIHIINECSQLAKRTKTGHDWVRKVIH